LQRELGDRFGQAETWDSLGYASQRLGLQAEAISCYRTAAGLFQAFDDRYNEADSTASLGDAHYAAGDIASAMSAWGCAADILDQLRHPDAGKVRAKLTGAQHASGGCEAGGSTHQGEQLNQEVRNGQRGGQP
jgi:tetratricopeptide (TPR) repeat protein